MKRFLLPYFLVLCGFCAVSGGYWDIWWHVAGKVETFYTLPHLVIYASVFVGGITVLGAVVLQLIRFRTWKPARLPRAREMALVGTGSLFQLAAGLLDNAYHNWVGFDVTIWSPPHLLVIFGGVLYALGVAEWFSSLDRSLPGAIGYILCLGCAVAFMQFALAEFDIQSRAIGVNVRWNPYVEYYAVLFLPIILFSVISGSRTVRFPVGTLVTGVAFAMKYAVYAVWATTFFTMYFPIWIVAGGLLFDAAYLLLRRRQDVAEWAASICLSIGLAAAVVVQSPLALSGGVRILITMAAAIVTGAIIVSLLRSVPAIPFGPAAAASSLLLFFSFGAADVSYAHPGHIHTNRAPDLHPIYVLIEFGIVMALGFYIREKLAGIGKKS